MNSLNDIGFSEIPIPERMAAACENIIVNTSEREDINGLGETLATIAIAPIAGASSVGML